MLLPLQGVNTMAIRNPGCRFACLLPLQGAKFANMITQGDALG
nr:MAG TPA: hypothetical protein [Caudoviricetes sp.]